MISSKKMQQESETCHVNLDYREKRTVNKKQKRMKTYQCVPKQLVWVSHCHIPWLIVLRREEIIVFHPALDRLPCLWNCRINWEQTRVQSSTVILKCAFYQLSNCENWNEANENQVYSDGCCIVASKVPVFGLVLTRRCVNNTAKYFRKLHLGFTLQKCDDEFSGFVQRFVSRC